MANKILLIATVIIIIIAGLALMTSKPLGEPSDNMLMEEAGSEPLIGGSKDEHGCLIAAGYQWCPSAQKCQRMWEEYCEEFKEQFRGDTATEMICTNYEPENCPEACVVCPPCPECSSLVCQTEEFCAALSG